MLVTMTNHFSASRQRGLALIMSLVILLVLTLLGVAAMNTSNLQLLMTGNSQYQTTALNTAEGVIRDAENFVASYVNGTATLPASGYYDLPGGASPIELNGFDWSSANVVTSGSSQYIIEYTGDTNLDSASIAWRQSNGIAGSTVSVFRITARSPASRGAMRYVQSIFVTLQSPLAL